MTGSGPYTINSANGNYVNEQAHANGAVVQLYPTFLSLPVAAGDTTIVVNNLMGGTAQLVQVGSMIRVMDVNSGYQSGTDYGVPISFLPGYDEWFQVTGITGSGPYTLKLDHPAAWWHTTGTAEGTPILGLTVGATPTPTATQFTVLGASGIADLAAGVGIAVAGVVFPVGQQPVVTSVNYVTGLVTVTAGFESAPTAGAAVTQYIPTTLVEVWEQTSVPASVGANYEPTATALQLVNAGLRRGEMTLSVTAAEALPTTLQVGDSLAVVISSIPAFGSSVQQPYTPPTSASDEFFLVREIDRAAQTIYLDHAPLTGHGQANSAVLVGSFTNSMTVQQAHFAPHRVLANGIACSIWFPRASELPYFYAAGFEDSGELFRVLDYTPASSTTLAADAQVSSKSFSVTSIPTGWNTNTVLTFGNAYHTTAGTGGQDIMSIQSISGTGPYTVTMNPPANNPTGSWFKHSVNDKVMAGPYQLATTPFTRYAPQGEMGAAFGVALEPAVDGCFVDVSPVTTNFGIPTSPGSTRLS